MDHLQTGVDHRFGHVGAVGAGTALVYHFPAGQPGREVPVGEKLLPGLIGQPGAAGLVPLSGWGGRLSRLTPPVPLTIRRNRRQAPEPLSAGGPTSMPSLAVRSS